MIEFGMTYIIASKSEGAQKEKLQSLLKSLFDKELTESPDIHILNPGEENSIGIEEVKELQQSMRFKPFQEEKQVAIILQSEKLTTQAQNSILKTLEESSETSIYILCVDNERNLLSTIRSRGRVLYPKGGKTMNPAPGGDDKLLGIVQKFWDLNPVEQFDILEEYSESKVLSLSFINALQESFREQLELDIKNGNIDSSQRNLEFLRLIEKSREKISSNCNRKLTLEAMIMQLKT